MHQPFSEEEEVPPPPRTAPSWLRGPNVCLQCILPSMSESARCVLVSGLWDLSHPKGAAPRAFRFDDKILVHLWVGEEFRTFADLAPRFWKLVAPVVPEGEHVEFCLDETNFNFMRQGLEQEFVKRARGEGQ